MEEFDGLMGELFIAAVVAVGGAWVMIVIYAWWHIGKKPVLPQKDAIGCAPDQRRKSEGGNGTSDDCRRHQ